MYLTEKIAISLGNLAEDSLSIDVDKKQIVIYGAINLLQTLLSIFWIMIFGLIFDVLYEAIIYSFTNAILRKYSGGVHASSPNRCLIIGTFFTTIYALMIKQYLSYLDIYIIVYTVGMAILISIAIIHKNAPVDSVKKPIKEELKPNFKSKSMKFIGLMCILIFSLFALNMVKSNLLFIKTVLAITLGVLWQSISLTKGGIYFFDSMDRFLKLIMKGGKEHGK